MRLALNAFRPSAFGDAGGRQAETSTDWLLLHANEFWRDDAGYVFLILGGAGLQSVYTPTAQLSAKFFPAAGASTPQVVSVLKSRGRKVTPAELEQLKAGRAVFAPAAPVMQTFTAPASPIATVDAAVADSKKPKKRKRAAPTPFYRKSWFPLALGGGAAVAIILALVVRRMRSSAAPAVTK